MGFAKYADKTHAIAKEHGRVMFKWEMDKRYVPDEDDRVLIQNTGTMSREKCQRVWEILLEPDPIPKIGAVRRENE